MSAFMAELIGTMLIVIMGGGVVAGSLLNKSKANNSGWIVITFGWAMGVVLAIYAVGRFSGAHLNPAVTIALASLTKFPWAEVPKYLAGQMLGGFIGGIVVYFHYLPHWRVTKDRGAKLAVFSTAPAIRSTWANLSSEILGTFILVTGILGIGANKFVEGFNPFFVGLLILGIGLSLGGTTGYAINPARDLGPRLAFAILPISGKGSPDWGYSWIPVVGPIIGGFFGAQFYQYFFENGDGLLFWPSLVIVVWVNFIAFWKETVKISASDAESKLIDVINVVEKD
ncbi:MAG: aquaporin family protein [Oligoflexia bacterium]|nr:aquaporin family protein [Oligoflexia bacterium]